MRGPTHERATWLARHILPHEPALRAWLGRGRTRSMDVDDVVQESYAVLADLKSVDHIAAPKAYFFSVARSIVLQHVRRSAVISIDAMVEIDALRISQEAPSPEDEVSGREELRHVAERILRLPDRCRQAFVLRKIHGLSQREIAARMGVSEPTVEKQIGAALRALLRDHERSGGATSPEPRRIKSAKRRTHGQAPDRR